MAHCSSIFAQLLRLVPRHVFETLAREHHAGGPLREMSRWKQFVAMVAAQLTGRQSLRESPPSGRQSRTRGRRC